MPTHRLGSEDTLSATSLVKRTEHAVRSRGKRLALRNNESCARWKPLQVVLAVVLPWQTTKYVNEIPVPSNECGTTTTVTRGDNRRKSIQQSTTGPITVPSTKLRLWFLSVLKDGDESNSYQTFSLREPQNNRRVIWSSTKRIQSRIRL